MAEQTVELAPCESQIVTFEAVPSKAKTYNVSVDGLSGSFKAITEPPECTPGATICAGYGGYDLYECTPEGRWKLVEENSSQCRVEPPECVPGTIKCEGYDLYECTSLGKWKLVMRNSPQCGYEPPECIPGTTLCAGYGGYDLYECTPEGRWKLVEENSSQCRYAF